MDLLYQMPEQQICQILFQKTFKKLFDMKTYILQEWNEMILLMVKDELKYFLVIVYDEIEISKIYFWVWNLLNELLKYFLDLGRKKWSPMTH